MTITVEIEHAVTIIEGKLCVFESDVIVTATVSGEDGEVTIDNIEMSGLSLDREARRRGRAPITIPMTDSSNPHMVRLGNWAMETLYADDDFIAKAQAKAGLVYVGLGGNDPDGHFKFKRQTEAA